MSEIASYPEDTVVSVRIVDYGIRSQAAKRITHGSSQKKVIALKMLAAQPMESRDERKL